MALATSLVVMPLAAAIARTVALCDSVKAPVYTVEDVVGVLPSVV